MEVIYLTISSGTINSADKLKKFSYSSGRYGTVDAK